MNEREALEYIVKECYPACKNECNECDEIMRCPYYIATQALAPQEDNGLYIPQETAQNEFFLAECTGGETDTPQECDVKECAIELKYAPRKCEYFCMGDCCLPDTNRSCGTDKDNCEYYNLYAQLLQLKAENEQLTQKLEKARWALKAISKAHSETVTRIMKYAQQILDLLRVSEVK